MSTRTTAFRDLARWADGNSPLYARLCRTVAGDDDLLALADAVPGDRSAPHVLLAAVHYLLLRGDDHPLGAYYASVVDDPTAPDDELPDHFREFCRDHEERLRELLASRRTQTNAVRRSAVLYPALARVARAVESPLVLVELGASAGLNLELDRYRYDLGAAGTGGPEDAAVTLSSEVRTGDPPVPADPPRIRSRVGVDLNPLDATDDEDADWLRALVWPEHAERRRLLAAALAVAREYPPPLVRGDVVASLPGVVGGVPADVPVCVVDTLVGYQLPDAKRERLTDRLRTLATERPLHWLSGGARLDDDYEGVPLRWTRGVDGAVRTVPLARFHPHCEWIDWYGD